MIPNDPAQHIRVVIYFQNSGRLPARFAWGTTIALPGSSSKATSSGIIYLHPDPGLEPRTRDKKTGSVGTQGESNVIPGESIYASTLGEISPQDFARLTANNMSLMIMELYSYCDELGDYAQRSFVLRYLSNPTPSSFSFDLVQDTGFGPMPLPPPTDTIEYLSPCETFAEREQNKNNH